MVIDWNAEVAKLHGRYGDCVPDSEFLALVERVYAEGRRDGASDIGRATILFHGGGEWSAEKANEWYCLTGTDEATSKVLCDFIRQCLAKPVKP